MKSTTKLSSERREAIIRAVRRVFAEKGFHGTTTRELAESAGVSEALLFKHFPNKEELYSGDADVFAAASGTRRNWSGVKALEASTSTLVLIVHMMVARILAGVRRRRGCDDPPPPDDAKHDGRRGIRPAVLPAEPLLLDDQGGRVSRGRGPRGRGESWIRCSPDPAPSSPTTWRR